MRQFWLCQCCCNKPGLNRPLKSPGNALALAISSSTKSLLTLDSDDRAPNPIEWRRLKSQSNLTNALFNVLSGPPPTLPHLAFLRNDLSWNRSSLFLNVARKFLPCFLCQFQWLYLYFVGDRLLLWYEKWVMMESYLNENFDVKPKHSTEEVLQRWRNVCGVVKNPKRRFRFTANLSKRYEAAAMRRTNQVYMPKIKFKCFLLSSIHSGRGRLI